MHGQANVGESILNFGAFVKTEATDEFVAEAATSEGFLEGPGLKVGAIFDSAGLIGIVVEQLLQFFGDKFGLGLRVTAFEVAEISSGRLLGAKSFAEAVGIIFDHSAGRIQDALRGTVISFEANDFGFGKIAREAEQDGDIGAAPAVYGLVFVADDTDIVMRSDEQAQQIVLHAVSVLIFVDMDILEAPLPFFANGGGIAQKLRGAEEKVVEINGLALRENFFVLRIDIGGVTRVGSKSFAAHDFGRFGVALGKADLAQDGAWLQFVVSKIQRSDGKFDGGKLVGIVENGKI